MRRISGTRELLYLEQMEARFLLCVAAPPGTAAAGELHVISNMHDPADVAAQLRKAADKIEHEAVRIREVTPL